MTDVVISHTDRTGAAGGTALAETIGAGLPGKPDAVILFASPRNDHLALLGALRAGAQPGVLVGCSSAGEFTHDVAGEGLTCAVALRNPDMQFRAAVGERISADRERAAQQIADGFAGLRTHQYRYRTALIFADALAGYTEGLIDALTHATMGIYQFCGGGAGDDARFQETYVFCNDQVYSDAAVALEILSNKPLGIGARHAWVPSSQPLRVTDSDGMRVVSLNVSPAAEVFEAHATATNQVLDRADPLPFFLHNVIGVATPDGHKLRVPLGITADGGVQCAADVPRGATARIMATEEPRAAAAAALAVRDAVGQLERAGSRPKAALFFDCVATRLRLGAQFGGELDAVARELGSAPFAGFNSYGQIVRAEGQFGGFHNCTAVVCVIPE